MRRSSLWDTRSLFCCCSSRRRSAACAPRRRRHHDQRTLQTIIQNRVGMLAVVGRAPPPPSPPASLPARLASASAPPRSGRAAPAVEAHGRSSARPERRWAAAQGWGAHLALLDLGCQLSLQLGDVARGHVQVSATAVALSRVVGVAVELSRVVWSRIVRWSAVGGPVSGHSLGA